MKCLMLLQQNGTLINPVISELNGKPTNLPITDTIIHSSGTQGPGWVEEKIYTVGQKIEGGTA